MSVVSLLLVVCGAPPIPVNAASEARAVAAVEKARGKAYRDNARPGKPVVAVVFTPHSSVTDGVADVLRDVPYVTSLTLRYATLTDKGAVNLRKLDRLRYLDLSDTRITDKGVVNLKDLPLLERLLSPARATLRGNAGRRMKYGKTKRQR
jgi:hypothetical protein